MNALRDDCKCVVNENLLCFAVIIVVLHVQLFGCVV